MVGVFLEDLWGHVVELLKPEGRVCCDVLTGTSFALQEVFEQQRWLCPNVGLCFAGTMEATSTPSRLALCPLT